MEIEPERKRKLAYEGKESVNGKRRQVVDSNVRTEEEEEGEIVEIKDSSNDRNKLEEKQRKEHERDKHRESGRDARSHSKSYKSHHEHRDRRDVDNSYKERRRSKDRDVGKENHSSSDGKSSRPNSTETQTQSIVDQLEFPQLDEVIRQPQESEEEFQKRVLEQLNKKEGESEEEALRKSRERRKAIMEKYKKEQQQQPAVPSIVVTPTKSAENPVGDVTEQKSNENGSLEDAHKSNEDLVLFKFAEEDGRKLNLAHVKGDENEVYADDATEQLNDDKRNVNGQVINPKQLKPPSHAEQHKQENTSNDDSFDMFTESPKPPPTKNTFDMFAESPQNPQQSSGLPKLNEAILATSEVIDDSEGYYCSRIGEVLNGKYTILGTYGKGVFSTVVRARNNTANNEVAIKILRNNELMKKMGLKEIQLLKDIENQDPDNKYNCIRLLDHFEDRDHLCLVFEAMPGGNLREVLKKYGTKIGLSIKAVRLYAQKMMLALKLLKKCKIIHADIKLDNILVNEAKTSIKIGDFGSASSVTENAITPYLVSRFYRAPEIVIGYPYGFPIDMWSIGCCLYELCTGRILFPGKSNNDMMYRFMEVAGPFPKKMIKKGEFASLYFEETQQFKRIVKDKLTDKEYVQLLSILKSNRDLKAELLNSPYELNAEEKKLTLQLYDLLSQIFTLDPNHRITPEEAIRHPFISGL